MDLEENLKLGELIIQLADGNKSERNDASVKIYGMISKILYFVGNTYYNNKEDIEDSIQTLMLDLFVKAKKYVKNENACGWLMRIYRNSFINFEKRRIREREYYKQQVEILRSNNSDFSGYYEKYLLLNYVISSLTDYERELFYRKYLYGYSINEIAQEFHIPKSTLQYRLEQLEIKIRKL